MARSGEGVHGDAAHFAHFGHRHNVGEGVWIEPNFANCFDRSHLGTKLHAAGVDAKGTIAGPDVR
jgi:hypothetical protein